MKKLRKNLKKLELILEEYLNEQEIFKKNLLEHENEELLRSIEEGAKKSETNKLMLLYFLPEIVVKTMF